MPTAVIIDDMPLAIASLASDIGDHCPDIEILDNAESVVSGAKLIKKNKPDIVFLDIEMPDGLGFDLLDLLNPPFPCIIFVTASNEYAIRAFRYAAIDYLMKPVDPEQLVEAVKRAKENLGTKGDQISIAKKVMAKQNSDQIALNTQQELKIVNIVDIIRCQSDSNYTTFYFSNGEKIIVTKPLKEYENTLAPSGFIRTHQSHLVNLKSIESFQKSDGGYLVLKNGEMIPVSVRKRPNVIEAIKGLN